MEFDKLLNSKNQSAAEVLVQSNTSHRAQNTEYEEKVEEFIAALPVRTGLPDCMHNLSKEFYVHLGPKKLPNSSLCMCTVHLLQ